MVWTIHKPSECKLRKAQASTIQPTAILATVNPPTGSANVNLNANLKILLAQLVLASQEEWLIGPAWLSWYITFFFVLCATMDKPNTIHTTFGFFIHLFLALMLIVAFQSTYLLSYLDEFHNRLRRSQWKMWQTMRYERRKSHNNIHTRKMNRKVYKRPPKTMSEPPQVSMDKVFLFLVLRKLFVKITVLETFTQYLWDRSF